MNPSDTIKAIISLKKKLTLLKINSVVLDENKKNERKVIRKAIAALKAKMAIDSIKQENIPAEVK